jgi:tRNA-specific 2-thiouridylase
METNTIYVTTNLDDDNLWHQEIKLTDTHWINQKPKAGPKYQARLRYRGPLVVCELKGSKLILAEPQRGLAAGQSAVIYEDDRVLGGGIINV